MIGVALGVAVVVGGMLAYRHFVTHQVTDKGGMENPFLLNFPQDAVLQSLDWTRNAMNDNDCFSFFLRQEDGQYYASCDFKQAEEGKRLTREDAPLTAENWANVERCLKSEPHMSGQEDSDDGVIVSDESSRLKVAWKTAEGETEYAEYAGSESELQALLQDILARTPAEYAPPEAE